jgi:hypothetical protein
LRDGQACLLKAVRINRIACEELGGELAAGDAARGVDVVDNCLVGSLLLLR